MAPSDAPLRDSPSRPLVFALNGSRVELFSVDPAITLLTYLRLHTRFYGTKLSCGEGGCGACLVLLSNYDVQSKSVEDLTINACLTLLCSIDGCAVTTTEGLGSTQKGFHAVQERLVGFHGSQCGFCSPGICIAMYGALRRALNKERKGSILAENNCGTHEFLRTLPGLSTEDAQGAIVGNICRCTGYRPILDACKSFAGDVDVEDLGANTFWDSDEVANANLLPAYSSARDPVFPEFLIEELNLRETGSLHGRANCGTENNPPALNIRYVDGIRNSEERLWLEMRTLEAVFEALQLYQGRRDVKLVVGNTSAGYYKQQKPQVFIDISHVPELLLLRETEDSLEVGSAVTLEKLIREMEAKPVSASVCHGIASHVKKVANPHVRNRASVGGNLIMAQQFCFDSDLVTLFLAIDVRVKLIDAKRQHHVLSMEKFLQKGSFQPGMILESISIPMWLDRKNESLPIKKLIEAPAPHTSSIFTKRCFKSYRAAPRRFGNSLALLNAAFLAEISVSSEAGGIRSIVDVRLAFGAFGQSHAMRAHKAENFLMGKTTSPAVLLDAIGLLKTELAIPLKETRKASYRSSVAIGFLFEFFRPFLPEVVVRNGGITPFSVDGVELSNGNGKANGSYALTCGVSESHSDIYDSETFKDRIYLSGKQIVPPFEKNSPLGKPIQKSEGKIQAAGEAVYVDDVLSPDGCLFAAFVISEKAFAKVESVDLKLALASPGVVGYISAADIPPGGANTGNIIFGMSEILFATDVVEYVGQPLGVVVADTPQHAKDAATKVRVAYDLESLGSAILSIEDAADRNSFFPIPPFITPAPVGDIDKGFSEAEMRIEEAEVRTGSQYYFYMENQTALAVPDEDDCMLIYSSCQSPANLQRFLAVCLGVPTHNIRVITRRVGGGFGGKAYRNTAIAAACAVAAYKLRKPVRMQLDRNTDMIMIGGRHPTKTIYSVGFTSCGKVTALKAKVFVDAGCSEDLSPAMPVMIDGGMKKYNWGSMNADYKVCRTNLSSKSAMRGPGHLQGSFIADTVIEHVAATLGLDVHVVIERNMHTLDSLKLFYSGVNVGRPEGYTLPSIWNSLSKRMEACKKAVHSFNSINKWCKRGLSIVPCVYNVRQESKPARVSIFLDGSVVVEVGGIELGQGLWTKVKQAAMYGLGQLWPGNAGALDSVQVRVVQADTISLPHGGITSSSTTSEGSCESVRLACEVLVSRLMPVKLKKQDESIGISWLELIRAAVLAGVDLSAQIRWFPDKSTQDYLNYGAAASEVEVNILTGETSIIQVDLIYDCGKSLNPAVDIGQIEGSFVQGIGFFMTEEFEVDNSGKVITNGTWTYKPPTIDNIPHRFFVEIINGATHQNVILSSKACGEPPLLLAGSVHSAIKRAIEASREDHLKGKAMDSMEMRTHLKLDAPATIEKVKILCGLDSVEQYLKYQTSKI